MESFTESPSHKESIWRARSRLVPSATEGPLQVENRSSVSKRMVSNPPTSPHRTRQTPLPCPPTSLAISVTQSRHSVQVLGNFPLSQHCSPFSAGGRRLRRKGNSSPRTGIVAWELETEAQGPALVSLGSLPALVLQPCSMLNFPQYDCKGPA